MLLNMSQAPSQKPNVTKSNPAPRNVTELDFMLNPLRFLLSFLVLLMRVCVVCDTQSWCIYNRDTQQQQPSNLMGF